MVDEMKNTDRSQQKHLGTKPYKFYALDVGLHEVRPTLQRMSRSL